jgi:hypothetical protein
MCDNTPASIYGLRNIIGPVTLAALKAHYTPALCRLTWDLLPTSICYSDFSHIHGDETKLHQQIKQLGVYCLLLTPTDV